MVNIKSSLFHAGTTDVLLWENIFVDELLGRESEQLRAIEGYEFSFPTLMR